MAKTIFDETKTVKMAKIMKQPHAYKSYVSTHNIEILNFFKPELQLKDTESVIRSELTDLLTELKGFKFIKNR